ncbi:YsnF/AvaK domain-containing protein [Terrilactibacillus sp. BCM23-1]|uniref:YsnF/AvaK domain-containing protein n=1 Tax=Terrilactibacillus tamarindi TaxID=2599694 RepID=A0A6N8CNP1_9BACI|nr:YsnF/AvaK domain-containing protein [Terrilactibacillus tamarindi]MTT31712.1 YsnF/AvaK domain-containing protein [Terrilactibacillus tamarindi]
MTKSVVGVYDTPEETVSAIEKLTSKGLDSDDISVVTNRSDTNYVESQTNTNVNQTTDEVDRSSGSFFDKLKNYFTMDDLYTNDQRLTNLDIPNDQLDLYNAQLNDGKILLAVDTKADLDHLNDIDNTSIQSDYVAKEETSMPIREEELNINKEDVQTGEVELGKEVKTEQKNIDTPVKHDEIYVERRPVNDTKEASPVDDSETVRVPIVEEQVEVTKKPVVTDEIVVGKRTVEENEHISETVKKEEPRLNKKGKAEDVDDDGTI